MKFRHVFQVQAPLAAVREFHGRSASMGSITPPPVIARVHRAPGRLAEGEEMDFTLWLGPLPIHWLARIEGVSEAGFIDRQLSGPFEVWVHRHSFLPAGVQATQVVDEIEVCLKRNLLWRAVGLLMWLNLPVLFAYRSWKTRRLLEKPGSKSRSNQVNNANH